VEAGATGRCPAAVAWGALRPAGEGAERLRALNAGLAALLREHRPDAAAVERLFHTRNVRTAAAVGQARGVALLACAEAGVAVAEYTPTELKLAVAGYGGADKRQMRRMVAAQLGLERLPSPDDAADALGLCLCHLAGSGLRRRLAAGGAP
jgi:crossover junction endodeoxyribonuclease RuvC